MKKKAASKDTGVRMKTENDANDQYDKKKTLLSLWSKGYIYQFIMYFAKLELCPLLVYESMDPSRMNF